MTQAKDSGTAVDLMKIALALLDMAGKQRAAAHLQAAISAAIGEQPLEPGDALSPELLAQFFGDTSTD